MPTKRMTTAQIRQETGVDLAVFSPALRSSLKDMLLDPMTNDGVWAMMQRQQEFRSPLAAMLAGIALNPVARAMHDTALDAEWSIPRSLPKGREVVVGAGLTAAIYCAVRAAQGKPKPLVLEASNKVGGSFAVSKRPAFYLNSKNRPGDLDVPGRGGALNFLPGAVLQPSDISGEEYQTNDSLAWVIRNTLALFAEVRTNISVGGVRPLNPSKDVVVYGPKGVNIVTAKRAIIATGLSPAVKTVGDREIPDHPLILSYMQFMERMDELFPLAGMKRVAVIGAGDSGKTVIEALTGQGPNRSMSVSSLDYPRMIDWYGVDPSTTCQSWEQNNRSRYRRIGRLLGTRVTPVGNATRLVSGYNCVYVDEKPYDYAIYCLGYYSGTPIQVNNVAELDVLFKQGRAIGKGLEDRIIIAGPAAQITPTNLEERVLGSIPENRTALFRYAERTALAAATIE